MGYYDNGRSIDAERYAQELDDAAREETALTMEAARREWLAENIGELRKLADRYRDYVVADAGDDMQQEYFADMENHPFDFHVVDNFGKGR